MKTIVASIVIMVMLGSCGDGQKPSPRLPKLPVTPYHEEPIVPTEPNHKILIPYKRTAEGLIEVSVSINGVPFNMCWDTGSPETSISRLELMKLAKEKAVTKDDCICEEDSECGCTNEKVFNINEFFIHGTDNNRLTFYNVPMTVYDNYCSTMRIGQDIIRRLPKHTFNEEGMFIEFEMADEF